ncbi:hypothetical protein Mgra_00004303, partial [Meloidogyne graminicola]
NNLIKYSIENDENKKQLLVDNWKLNVVYLVKYPRITSLPDLSINCFKIEIWLKLKNIQFYKYITINNFFSLSFNSSENIINKLKHLGKPLLENKEEEKIIKIIENIFQPILIKDRLTRDKYGKGGLDFLAYDKSLQEQLIPKIEITKNNTLKLLDNKNITYIFENNLEFWNELFNLEKGIKNNEKDENDIIIFLNKFIKKIKNKNGTNDWFPFIETKNEWIESILKKYFYNGEYLIESIQNLNNEPINDIINKFDYYLTQITELFNNNIFLFGDEPTYADIYLFSVLIQFFEGKKVIEDNELNNSIEINEIEEIIENNNNNEQNKYIDNRINILYQFIEKMKEKLGFNKENEWINLKKYPLKLNYEEEIYLNNKYNGPFNIETNELIGINKLLDYERIFDIFSLFLGKKRFEKNKKANLWKKALLIIKGKSKPLKEDFNELIQKIIEKIIENINNSFYDLIRIKYYGTITLNCLGINLFVSIHLKYFDNIKFKKKFFIIKWFY